jgi:hypothetical protein
MASSWFACTSWANASNAAGSKTCPRQKRSTIRHSFRFIRYTALAARSHRVNDGFPMTPNQTDRNVAMAFGANDCVDFAEIPTQNVPEEEQENV